MTFGNPFGGAGGADMMDPALRQRILEMLAQQPTQDEVPPATPPGFSGFTPPDAPTNTMAMRLGDPNAPTASLASAPGLQDAPLPLSMSLAAPRGMPSPSQGPQGPLLNGTLDAPPAPASAPQITGPANSVSSPDASQAPRMPTLLGLQPPAMLAGAPAGALSGARPAVPPPAGGDEEDTPPAGSVAVPKVPTTYTGLPGEKPTAAPGAIPGAPAPGVAAPTVAGVPANGVPGSTMPQAAPSRPANTAPAIAEPSIWKKLGDAGIGDQMIAFGGGLLSGRNFQEGLGNAFQGVARAGQVQAATQLAQGKAQHEQASMLGNAAIYKKYFPNATDQEAIAAGSNSSIMTELMKRALPPTETYRTETDDKGNQWQVRTDNNQRQLLKAADEDKTQTQLTEDQRVAAGLPPGVYQKDANNKITTVATPKDNAAVLTEAERNQLGLPPGAYQRDLTTNRITPISPGGTSVNIDLGKKAAGETDAQILKKIDTSHDKAQGAIDTLGAISRQKQALDQGVISGFGSDFRTRAQAMAEQILGITPDEKLDPTYTFDAAAKQKGAALAKAISQSGHTTNMDLNLGQTIAGGDRDKTASALRQIVDAQEILARKTIDDHNKSVQKYVGLPGTDDGVKSKLGWYNVETPDVYRYGQGTPNPVADPGSVTPGRGTVPARPMTPAKELTFDPKSGSFK